jgi:hypothetical protein
MLVFLFTWPHLLLCIICETLSSHFPVISLRKPFFFCSFSFHYMDSRTNMAAPIIHLPQTVFISSALFLWHDYNNTSIQRFLYNSNNEQVASIYGFCIMLVHYIAYFSSHLNVAVILLSQK